MISDLGHIRGILGIIRLNGETKLIVNPWAAIGTDGLLIATSVATMCLSKNAILKTVGVLGSIWGVTAIGLEIAKLVSPGIDPIARESA
jgi:hypothetical protein